MIGGHRRPGSSGDWGGAVALATANRVAPLLREFEYEELPPAMASSMRRIFVIPS